MDIVENRRGRHMHFDKTVNLGQVITIIALVFTIIGMTNRMESRLTALETKVQIIMLKMGW